MTYADYYLSGSPDKIEAVLGVNQPAAVLGPTRLDGVDHACLRFEEGGQVSIPEGAEYDLASLQRAPETARAVLGCFAPNPTAPPPQPEEDF